MRIAYVCNEYPPLPHGGIGTFVETIAAAMHQAGHQVTIVGYGSCPGVRYDGGIRVVTLAESKLPKLAWIINRHRLYHWLKTAVRRGDIDVVELPEHGGLLPFRFPFCPVIVRLHLSHTIIALGSKKKRIAPIIFLCEYFTLKFHQHWIAVSSFILSETAAVFRLRPFLHTVIYNPVSSAKFKPGTCIDEGARMPIVFVGAVSTRKGATVLACALKEVLPDFPGLNCIYVGPVEKLHGRSSIKEIIREIIGPDLCRRVLFTGRVSHREAVSWMSCASVLAFPSTLEALPLVVIEAMSLGVPVIFSSRPPGPEIIENGKTGFLVDPTEPLEVAHALRTVLREETLAARIGQAGREAVLQRFSTVNCVEQSIAYYRHALAKAHGADSSGMR